MTSLNQLGRLVDGLSLVAREIAKRSQTIENAKNGDLETLIVSSLKSALVSATDLTGLTKGFAALGAGLAGGTVQESAKRLVYGSPNSNDNLSAVSPFLSEKMQKGADVMPSSQLNQVLDAELGPGWSSKLTSFDYEPMSAASIGQVHRALTKDGMDVAMKIQYPGVVDSIESDLENVKLLLDYTNLFPKGLYLDRAMKVAKEELSRECDYQLEASNQK
ncbi:hypothetical protein CRYUN_Cryun14cG0058600 [Craigia yunnanensis]